MLHNQKHGVGVLRTNANKVKLRQMGKIHVYLLLIFLDGHPIVKSTTARGPVESRQIVHHRTTHSDFPPPAHRGPYVLPGLPTGQQIHRQLLPPPPLVAFLIIYTVTTGQDYL